MVPFNIENMRSWYVYIVRVTPTYVYVTSARNGEAYTPKGSVQDTYKGRTVSKIRIHGSVHKDFMGAYLSTHFDTPRLAALNMYERTVLSVELQPYSLRQDGFTSAENWQSGFSRNIQQIAQKLEGSNVTEAFINGAQIIWLDQADLMNRAVSSEKLAKEPNFKLVPVRFININQLSASRAMKATEKYLRRAWQPSPTSPVTACSISRMRRARMSTPILLPFYRKVMAPKPVTANTCGTFIRC